MLQHKVLNSTGYITQLAAGEGGRCWSDRSEWRRHLEDHLADDQDVFTRRLQVQGMAPEDQNRPFGRWGLLQDQSAGAQS